LTLTFSDEIPGLSASDISLSGVSGVSKGTLSGTGPSYTLPISGFTASGTVSVAVSKTGYAVIGSPKDVVIYYKIGSLPYGITLDKSGTQPFTAANYGYGSQTPMTVTITNIGNQATGALTIALSGTNDTSFTLSKTSSNIATTGATDTFTVTPKTSLAVGTYTATVTVSGSNITSQSFTVSFTVNKAAAPAVTFPTATAITYGAALSTSSLSGGTTGRGTFTWQNGATIPTVTNSGYNVEFTPNDTATYDYTSVTGWNSGSSKVVRTVGITVNKATPTITTAPAAAPITSGQALSASTFSGGVVTNSNNGAVVAGTFAWTTPTTVPPVGTNSYGVTFTPTDTANYNTATTTVSITVTAAETTNSIGIVMVSIPGGSFDMGKELGTAGSGDVIPVHTVTLSAFKMSRTEVTQKQWKDVMGSLPANASAGSGDNYPVYRVNWYYAWVFCNKLSIKEGLSPVYEIEIPAGGTWSTNPDDWGTIPTSSSSTNAKWNAVRIVANTNGYRLPTEAQWEYAAKGGNGSPGNYTYAGSNTAGNVAWYNSNSDSIAHEVGTKQANGLGLYDMSGNVYELVWDIYGSYTNDPQTDPQGASSGTDRVTRGGGFGDTVNGTRSVSRSYQTPYNINGMSGLRVVRPE